MEKIVRGLYRHHTNRFLPAQQVVFNWAINEAFTGAKAQLFAQAAPGLTYPHVFECRYGIATEGSIEMTIWWLRFYRGVVMR